MVLKDSSQPSKRRRYDAAFWAHALRLTGESRSTQAAARTLTISPKLLYKWQKEALTPVAATRRADLAPATTAELRQLRGLGTTTRRLIILINNLFNLTP